MHMGWMIAALLLSAGYGGIYAAYCAKQGRTGAAVSTLLLLTLPLLLSGVMIATLSQTF